MKRIEKIKCWLVFFYFFFCFFVLFTKVMLKRFFSSSISFPLQLRRRWRGRKQKKKNLYACISIWRLSQYQWQLNESCSLQMYSKIANCQSHIYYMDGRCNSLPSLEDNSISSIKMHLHEFYMFFTLFLYNI